VSQVEASSGSPPELITVPVAASPPVSAYHDAGWLKAARRAKQLAWASLLWMSLEGILGAVAGFQAHSVGILTWAASSAVEGLASVIVVWRFTGKRTLSESSELRAQRWVAGSFFLLAPFLLYEAIHKLITGQQAEATLAFLDPLAAFVIAGIAAKEGLEMWRGENCDCHSVPGVDHAREAACADGCRD